MHLSDPEIDLAIRRLSFGDARRLLRAMDDDDDRDARLRIELAGAARLKDGTMTIAAAGVMLRLIARSLRRLKRPEGHAAGALRPGRREYGADYDPAELEQELAVFKDAERLSQLARRYAGGEVTWREIREEIDVAYGDLLLELAKQGLQLPRATAPKTPEQERMLKAMFDEAGRRARGES